MNPGGSASNTQRHDSYARRNEREGSIHLRAPPTAPLEGRGTGMTRWSATPPRGVGSVTRPRVSPEPVARAITSPWWWGGDCVSETSVLWASCGLLWPCGLPPPPLDVDGPRGVAITEVAPGPRAMNLEGQPGHHRGTAWEEQGSKAQWKEAGEHMYTHVQMLHKSRHTYTHAHRRVSAHPHTRTCV